MDANEMKHYICETFDGISVIESSGDTFRRLVRRTVRINCPLVRML